MNSLMFSPVAHMVTKRPGLLCATINALCVRGLGPERRTLQLQLDPMEGPQARNAGG